MTHQRLTNDEEKRREFLARVETLFATRGAEQYGGEAVSQLEHALQSAWAAERAGSPPELIAAALLHDVGHLLHPVGEDVPDRDARHEELGHRFLARFFGPAVVDPVLLHVPAKRYLCAAEPEYLSTLSPASVHSLGLQGGPMSADEAEAFRRLPRFAAAVALRRFDDEAKVPGLTTPPFEHFRPYLEAALATAS